MALSWFSVTLLGSDIPFSASLFNAVNLHAYLKWQTNFHVRIKQWMKLCEISGYNGYGYEDDCLLGYCVM
jgi:hypothetical protein